MRCTSSKCPQHATTVRRFPYGDVPYCDRHARLSDALDRHDGVTRTSYPFPSHLTSQES